jgi:prevent-host-death family protein
MMKGGNLMPSIISSTDLRNNYSEISKICHESSEPVFVTKNGQGDLAVMSIEAFELLNGRFDLYRLLDEGRSAAREGRKRPLADAMRDLMREIDNGQV